MKGQTLVLAFESVEYYYKGKNQQKISICGKNIIKYQKWQKNNNKKKGKNWEDLTEAYASLIFILIKFAAFYLDVTAIKWSI